MKSEKYEIKIIQGTAEFINVNVAKMQNEGWKLAGDITVTHIVDKGYTMVFVPMKRKLKA